MNSKPAQWAPHLCGGQVDCSIAHQGVQAAARGLVHVSKDAHRIHGCQVQVHDCITAEEARWFDVLGCVCKRQHASAYKERQKYPEEVSFAVETGEKANNQHTKIQAIRREWSKHM